MQADINARRGSADRHHRRAAGGVRDEGGVQVRGKIGGALSLWFSVFPKITESSLHSSLTAPTSRQLTAQDRATTLFIGCEVGCLLFPKIEPTYQHIHDLPPDL